MNQLLRIFAAWKPVQKTLALVVTGLLLSGHTFAQSEYIVKYRNARAVQSFAQYRLQMAGHHAVGKWVKVSIADEDKMETLANLYSDPAVEYIVPNIKMHAFTAPVDTNALKSQWAIAKVQAEKAWQRAGNRGLKKIVVAVIDTGVDYKHKNLAPNMVEGYDFIKKNNDPMDITSSANPGHGTHCAGIVGATGLIENGTVGLSPDISMMPLRFLDQNGSGDFDNAVKAVDYAVEKGARVISASWGATISRAQVMPLLEAIQRAEAKGVVFVVAAANDGRNNDKTEVYPANAGFSNTIAVAASNSSDAKPSWSNYGRGKVHVSSPGDGITSTLPKDIYGDLSGTSMATPLVSGLVGLILSQDDTLTPHQVRSLIQATGAKVGIETACDCRVDAFEAVDAVLSKKMFVHPFAANLAINDSQAFTGVYGKAPFTFNSSNPAVASIDDQGILKALTAGEVEVTVKDAAGVEAKSYKILVGQAPTDGPPDDGGGGGGGECPLGDPQLCQIICGIMPDLPWCQGK